MRPPAMGLLIPKTMIGVVALAAGFALGSGIAYGQHGGHAASAPHAAPAPHMSAPRVAAPAPRAASRPNIVVAGPPRSKDGTPWPVSTRYVPPPVATNPTSTNSAQPEGAAVSSRGSEAVLSNTTIGFPRPTAFGLTGVATARQGTVFYGDGHDMWVAPSRLSKTGIARTGTVRRHPFPPRLIGPVFYPFYYPIGFYGGFPGYGWGFGFGFGACDPFWGWSFACDGFGYGSDLFYDSSGDLPDLEPDTVSVGADSSSVLSGADDTANEEGDSVLCLTDGTVLLMSNYWLRTTAFITSRPMGTSSRWR